MQSSTIETDILVVGGGVSGIAAAVEAADCGYNVVLIEKEPFLGGMAIRMHRYFPKLCPPICGFELNFRRIKSNARIRFFTLATLNSISGIDGDLTASVRLQPRMVNDNCTACGDCAGVCPVEKPDEFNYGWGTRRAIYLPHVQAYPQTYIVDGQSCPGTECAKCISACRYGAIDLQMGERSLQIKCSSAIMATGWQPYDAARLTALGYGRFPNVITNMMMERLAAVAVSKGRRITRPSDDREISSIAFVQCAGSRDVNHLPYCSGVCCMASLKQASYVKDSNPETNIYIFYIDIRTTGMQEEFFQRIAAIDNTSLVRGKVSKISEDPATGDLIIEAEDTSLGKMVRQRVDMAVLATGIAPMGTGPSIGNAAEDGHGFAVRDAPGIFAAGCAKRPMDVSSSIRDATGTVLKSMQSARRRQSRGG
ncbi:MAG: CoB--CoM heterodisulfide reductase iron-sulfur subunit A family protein [Dehalococcoidia bacterium]